MTKLERLKKFEIPLAMPVIVSGVRTATVMIIGTATLAALVGAGGLGSFILLGIDRRNASLILIGAISSAILAILLMSFSILGKGKIAYDCFDLCCHGPWFGELVMFQASFHIMRKTISSLLGS